MANLDNVSDQSIDDVLKDLQDMSPEDLKAQVESVRDDSEEIKPPEGIYIKFNTVDLLMNLRLFASMNKSMQDILSRAALMEVGNGAVNVTMSDGIFRGAVTFPYQAIVEGFPKSVVLDYESLVKIARFAGRYLFIVAEGNSFYVDFFGGRVHLPTFRVEPELIKVRTARKGSTSENVPVDVNTLLRNASIASDFLAANQIPNLAFMFVKQDSVWLSNGYTVMKLVSPLGMKCSFRKSDLSFVKAACQIGVNEGMSVSMAQDSIALQTGHMTVQVPAVSEVFPSSYESNITNFDFNKYFAVDFSKLYLLLSVLSKVYRSSGIVKLRSEDGVLYLESKSLDEDTSVMALSKAQVGDGEDFELSFSVVGMLAVLRSLKQFSYLKLTVKGSTFCLFNDNEVYLAVFGTETQVKSDVFKQKKACKKAAYQAEDQAKRDIKIAAKEAKAGAPLTQTHQLA